MNYTVWKITADDFIPVAQFKEEEVAKIFTDLSNGWNEAGIRYDYTENKPNVTPIW